MRIGISTLPTERSTDVAVLASKAEELGFDSIWDARAECLARPHRVGYAEGVGGHRRPLRDAGKGLCRDPHAEAGYGGQRCKPPQPPCHGEAGGPHLDMYSGGRFLFGIGVGGLKEEGEIMGADFPRRWTQGREAVEAMKVLWTTEASEYHGHYYDLPPVYCFPKPAQRPHPPIILGGRAPRVLKRVAEWGDGWIPIDVTPEQVREGRQALDDLARAAKRDPASIEISVLTPAERDAVERFFDAGADRVIVPVEADGEKESLDALERIAETVLR